MDADARHRQCFIAAVLSMSGVATTVPVRAQAPPAAASAKVDAPATPAPTKAPGPTSAEIPPGNQGALPTTMDALHKEIDTAYRPKPMGHRIKFNLQDADLSELVNHMSGMTGKRFIYDAKLRQIKATVVSPTPVTLAEAYEAFLSILEANGLTVVPHGAFLKIVDTGGVVNKSTPVYSRGAPVPDSDRMVTRLYRLKNVGSEETAQLLNKFKSKDGDISTYAPGRLLIMTDTGSNVRRMIRIVEELDVGGAGSHMWIEPVHYGTAADLAKRINELFELGKPPAAGQPPGSAGGLGKVVADDQTNSLIIVGTEDSYLKLLELMKRIDAKLSTNGSAHVLPLQHAVAEELAAVVTQMLAGERKEKGPAAADLFENEIKVTADKATNSLVITATGRDYASLRLVIDQLDQPRRQVFIEAVIMDVSVDHKNQLGLSYHAGGLAQIGSDRDSLFYGGLDPMTTIGTPSTTDLQGLALGVRGPEISGSNQLIGVSVPAFGVVLNALATSGDANVLATPHILATDNVAAEISVGENIPLQENIGGSTSSALQSSTGTSTTTSTALSALTGSYGLGFSSPRQDVGTKIKVMPHINESSQVRLEIDEEISERGATSGTLGAVSITKRTAKTTIVVSDQQTVVIGGLMRDAVTTSKSSIPVLGDLPVLGVLFRKTTDEKRKTNLLLILTPYVVRDQTDLRRIFERKMQERQEFLDRHFVFANEKWTPPQDYAHTNGLVEDIRQAYRELDERRRLEEESTEVRPVLHEPSEAVEISTSPGASHPRATPGAAAPTPVSAAMPAAASPGATPPPANKAPATAPPAPATPAAPTPRGPRRPGAAAEAPLNIQRTVRNVNPRMME
jgi:general secretion pathway protein D